jgi:hypothetical protein
VTLRGTDYVPSTALEVEPVSIRWNGVEIAQARTNSGGNFTTTLMIPTDADFGDHLISARQSGVAGTPSVGFRVEAKYEVIVTADDGRRLTARVALTGTGDGGGRTNRPVTTIYQWQESQR